MTDRTLTIRWPWTLKKTDGLPDHFVLVDALGEQATVCVEGTSAEWIEIISALRGPRSHDTARRVAVSWDARSGCIALRSPRNSAPNEHEWFAIGHVKAFEIADSLEQALVDTLCPKCRERGNRVKVPSSVRWEICARCRGEYGSTNTNPEGY